MEPQSPPPRPPAETVPIAKETTAEAAHRLRSELGLDACIICILGATEFRGTDSEALVKAIASKLAAAVGSQAKFVTGGMAGVQETFAKHCGDGSRVWNLLPVGQSSGYSSGTDINAGADLEERKAIFGLLGDIYITAEGGPSVSQEATAAFARGAGLVPLIRTGGASSGMFDFPQMALQKPSFSTEEQWCLLANKDAPVEASAAALTSIVETCVAESSSKDKLAETDEGEEEDEEGPLIDNGEDEWSVVFDSDEDEDEPPEDEDDDGGASGPVTQYQMRQTLMSKLASKAADKSGEADKPDGPQGKENPLSEMQAALKFVRTAEVTIAGQDDADDDQKKTEPPPLKDCSGWVLKTRAASLFGGTDWRWLTLQNKQIRWYKDKEDPMHSGMIDFDLVSVEVVPLFGEGNGRPKKNAKGSQCCGQRKAGSLFGLLFGESPSASFHICAVGQRRAFEMGFPHEAEADDWVKAMQQHVARADPPPVKVLNNFDFKGDQWWRVTRISPAKFEQLADTGDVLLFRSKGTFPWLIRKASGKGRFDHVGLIIKLRGGKLGLLEATGGEGVGLCNWDDFLAYGWHHLYPQLALRRAQFPRTRQRLRKLQDWVGQVLGKPYGLTVSKLLRRESVHTESTTDTDEVKTGDDNFFCSQLVAEALKVLEVIPRGKSSTQFWPSTFSARSEPIECEEGCSFDPENLTIDFSLDPRLMQSPDGGGGSKQRDATTNWG